MIYWIFMFVSQVALVVKSPPANAGDIRDTGSIPGLPCPSLGDLSNPGMETVSPATPELKVDSLQLSHQGSSYHLKAYFLGCMNDHV